MDTQPNQAAALPENGEHVLASELPSTDSSAQSQTASSSATSAHSKSTSSSTGRQKRKDVRSKPGQPRARTSSRARSVPNRQGGNDDFKANRRFGKDIRDALKSSAAVMSPEQAAAEKARVQEAKERAAAEKAAKRADDKKRRENELEQQVIAKRQRAEKRVASISAKINALNEEEKDRRARDHVAANQQHADQISDAARIAAQRALENEEAERMRLTEADELDRIIVRTSKIGDTIAQLSKLTIDQRTETQLQFDVHVRFPFIAAVRDQVIARFDKESTSVVRALNTLFNPAQLPHPNNAAQAAAYAQSRDAALTVVNEQFGRERTIAGRVYSRLIDCEQLPAQHANYVAEIQGTLRKAAAKGEALSMDQAIEHYLKADACLAQRDISVLLEIAQITSPSTAIVERGFSFMNDVKVADRSCLSAPILDALLLIAIEGPTDTEQIVQLIKRAVRHWHRKKLRRVDIA